MVMKMVDVLLVLPGMAPQATRGFNHDPLTAWVGEHKLTFRAGCSGRTSFVQSLYCPEKDS